jgi:hypothetical protein
MLKAKRPLDKQSRQSARLSFQSSELASPLWFQGGVDTLDRGKGGGVGANLDEGRDTLV